eukprot:3532614-Prymnesium_polylepis.1
MRTAFSSSRSTAGPSGREMVIFALGYLPCAVRRRRARARAQTPPRARRRAAGGVPRWRSR